MRLRESAPTRWPAPEQLAAWWREEVGDALDELVSGPRAAGLLRAAGVGVGPGSRWEASHPGQRGASAEVEITGVPGDRGLRAAGRLASDPGREAVLDVDGLDVPRRLVSRSSVPHLGWDVVATADPGRLLHARLELDWLLVVVSAAVRPRGPVDHLEVRLDVRGRGAWRPVLAPLLRRSAGPVRRELATVVRVAAAAVERRATEPAGPPRDLDSLAAGASRPVAAPVAAPVGDPVGDPAGRVRRLDLSWLASPVRTVRHLGATSAGAGSGGPLRRLRRWSRAAGGPP